MGSWSDESIRRRKGRQDGNEAFCQNSLITCITSLLQNYSPVWVTSTEQNHPRLLEQVLHVRNSFCQQSSSFKTLHLLTTLFQYRLNTHNTAVLHDVNNERQKRRSMQKQYWVISNLFTNLLLRDITITQMYMLMVNHNSILYIDHCHCYTLKYYTWSWWMNVTPECSRRNRRVNKQILRPTNINLIKKLN